MTSWSIDTSHSEVAFSVRHMMFAKVRGSFTRWNGTVAADADGRLSALAASVEVDSIDTREAQRDGRLKSADFFDAANHPSMRFESTAVRGDGPDFQVDGLLTIRGTTRPITLSVEHTGGGKGSLGNTRQGYRATATFQRSAFGLTWNAALELGGVLVGEKVDLEIEAQIVAAMGAQ